MTYPCSGVNSDDRVAEIIENHTGIKYAKTIALTYDFSLPKSLYRFDPTIHISDREGALRLAEKFLKAEGKEPKLFYI